MKTEKIFLVKADECATELFRTGYIANAVELTEEELGLIKMLLERDRGDKLAEAMKGFFITKEDSKKLLKKLKKLTEKEIEKEWKPRKRYENY